MALVIHQQPQELTPAYNNQIFVALSNQIAIPDFKYIVTVTVNSDTANTYTEPILQRPDGRMVFDSKEWVKNYIEHYFNPNISLVSPVEIATNKSVSVSVSIKEYYSGSIQSTTAVVYTAFDACLTDADFRNYDYNEYTFAGTTGNYFLSKDINSITPDKRIVLGQDVWVHTIFNSATPVDNIRITQKRAGVTIQTVSVISLPAASFSYTTYVTQASTKIFTSPLVGDTVTVDFLNGVMSQLKWTYTVKEICTNYTDNILYYLDRTGNVLFFHFDKISKKTHTKKTNKVTLNKDTLNTITNQYGSNTWDREDHIISNAIESTLLLNTDWITEDQSLQLKDLWDSPLVWLWDGSALISVNPPGGNYEEFKSANESLFQYNVTLDLGITETRQRGI